MSNKSSSDQSHTGDKETGAMSQTPAIGGQELLHSHEPSNPNGIVQLSGKKFMLGCLVAALAVLLAGPYVEIPKWFLALEVFATIIALFVFGSIKYQIHKNALTYGCGAVILATFFAKQGTHEAWHQLTEDFHGLHSVSDLATIHGIAGLFHGLDSLVHIDTMLFILGLTFFVSVIAQTRLLETITFVLLRWNKGHVLPTVLCVTAVVSVSSGILDGVSMIGLTIRTLVIILMLAAAPTAAVRYAVIVCTVVTTVCGMWLAYGEPPNLIMKANVEQMIDGKSVQLLNDAFFLRYCAPAAVLSFICVAISLGWKLKGLRVDLNKLDIVQSNAATIRFLQAERHGEVFSPIEFVEQHRAELGPHFHRVEGRVRKGEAVGLAMVREDVDARVRKQLLGHYVSEDLAARLDEHYVLESKGQSPGMDAGETALQKQLNSMQGKAVWARRIGILALLPFVALLITHALNHAVPLFLASFAGFAVAILGIGFITRMRRLALHEAKHEFGEYYFLFPLFLSITLLTKVAFFDDLKIALQHGIESLGTTAMALAQFYGATFLSALLDNNVVADFAGRAIKDLPEKSTIFLFALAQIAGYAAGGCWTHIGSAQSVVAYAFIQREVDSSFTPVQWIKAMTPLLLMILAALTALILVAGFIFH